MLSVASPDIFTLPLLQSKLATQATGTVNVLCGSHLPGIITSSLRLTEQHLIVLLSHQLQQSELGEMHFAHGY